MPVINSYIVQKAIISAGNYIRGATDVRSLLDVSDKGSVQGLLATGVTIKKPPFYDFSHWEIIEDWNALASSPDRPLLFGTKATENTFYKDPTFPEYFTKAKSILGSRRLAYHFFRKSANPTLQANFFIDYIEPYITNDDILCLDVEEGGETASMLWAFTEQVKKRRPNNMYIIYSGKYILNAIVMTAGEKEYFKKIKTWIANYPDNPNDYDYIPSWVHADPERWGECIAWQYSDRGIVTGVDSETDLNLMSNGFVEWLGGTTTPPEPPEPPVEPPTDETLYVGKVKASATPYVIVRDTPTGVDVGHLYPSTPIEGKGALVYANGYNRMELTSPMIGFVASEFLDYTIVGELPPPVVDDILTYPYSGVEYHQITRYGYNTFVLLIDMDSKKRAHVTNTHGTLVKPSTIASQLNADIVINGDGWENTSPYVPLSIGVSDGNYYNNVRTGEPFLNISRDNDLSIRASDYNGLYNTVAGFRHLIENGLKKDYLYGSEIQYTERHPRSAKGITKDGRLMLIGCEGRNAVGQGITLSELADIFLEFDAEVAFDNDSGGSFALIIDGVIQNVPSNPNNIERAVVSHLAIFITEEDNGGGTPTVGDLKLTSNVTGASRNVRRDAPSGKAHIYGTTFTTIPSTGYAIATDSYEYTANVYSGSSMVAKAGDVWYNVASVNGVPVSSPELGSWTAGIHLGVAQVIATPVVVEPPPVEHPETLPDTVWLSTELNGVRTEYKKVV